LGAGIFLLASVGVVLALFSWRTGDVRDPEPPDVWQKDGSPGDLRVAPDGDVVKGWFYAGYNDSGSAPGGKPRPLIIIGIEGRQERDQFLGIFDQGKGDHIAWIRERGDRNLWRTDEPVDTPSGRWWRYSTRWWKGARPRDPAPK